MLWWLLTLPFRLVWFVVALPFSYPLLAWPFFIAGYLSISVYLTIVLMQLLLKKAPVDIKAKYGAEWAFVTGASSGIGRAIVDRLADAGINVVLAALPNDGLLDKSMAELKAKHPALQFRACPVDLSKPDEYMPLIRKATDDIDVALVFNNAGFITTGFFTALPVERSLANYECNATCTIKITHHFARLMQDKKLKGLIEFTSSSAGFLPGPMTSMYPSTKAFLTMFSTSLAGELKSSGIDVLCIHPSPIASGFFKNATEMSAAMAFKKLANPPTVIADAVFANAGRFVVVDDGLVSVLFRLMLKVVDLDFLCEMVARFSHLSGDFQKMAKAQ